MTWDDGYDVTPERSEDELRSLVGAKANRLRTRNRLRLTGATAAVLALLVGVVALAQDDGSGAREQRVASGGETTTSSTSSSDEASTFSSGETDATTSTTTTGRGSGTSTTVRRPGSPTTTAAGPTTTRPSDTCGANTASLGGKEQTKAALIGAWTLCRPGSAFGSDATGVEIRADGRWSFLTKDSSGKLVRARGWENGGAWTVLEESQVNFRIEGTGGHTAIMQSAFSGDRNFMRLNNNGSLIGDYGRVPGGTTIVDAPPRQGDDCVRDEGGERAMSSEAELRTLVSRVWISCQAESFWGTTAAGVEIRSDGRWAELVRGPNGTLVRVADGKRSGTWETFDGTGMNGPGWYGLHFFTDEGSRSTYPAFATASSKMRLGYDGSFQPHDYVVAPSGTTVVDE